MISARDAVNKQNMDWLIDPGNISIGAPRISIIQEAFGVRPSGEANHAAGGRKCPPAIANNKR